MPGRDRRVWLEVPREEGSADPPSKRPRRERPSLSRLEKAAIALGRVTTLAAALGAVTFLSAEGLGGFALLVLCAWLTMLTGVPALIFGAIVFDARRRLDVRTQWALAVPALLLLTSPVQVLAAVGRQ